ncbi:synaptogyrin-like [Limulus polyphemus]|uniref:Synaptogyrin-like n=1 Tax=Limulus polyphemus TaxID=6850 RepID=A0ABM1TFZ0_LIMPO|nr:synaptogyrin-like [Limulus polyphemus]XP_022254795.1 synaptogyrin-like [Limulus polyphemus]XP_022254796.1 synaptogyrin-like [Limulus polyphemus]
MDSRVCKFAVGIGIIAFLGSIGFLVAEAMFEKFSSIKIQKRLVLFDLGFSGLLALMFLVGFCYLSNEWRHAYDPRIHCDLCKIRTALISTLVSIFLWACCAYLAFQQYCSSFDTSFNPYPSEDLVVDSYSIFYNEP